MNEVRLCPRCKVNPRIGREKLCPDCRRDYMREWRAKVRERRIIISEGALQRLIGWRRGSERIVETLDRVLGNLK